MQGFSIIICTYNPSIELLRRLFTAINQLVTVDFPIEVILIDNNSTPPLIENTVVHAFLSFKPYCRILQENEPGLTAARIAGIRSAQYDWLVFFDDDNEPELDYLHRARELINQNYQVGAWGPGTIEVEYLSQTNKWLQENKAIFQQRNEKEILYDIQQQWQACYPYGTGMIIKKEIALAYVERVRTNRYTMSDRKGKSLSSGGDVQMVLTGIELGYAAGVAPELKLKHLIEEDKTRFKYLLKLIYGTSSSYIKAYNQVFENNMLNPSAPSDLLVLKLYWYYYKQYRRQRDAKTALLSLTSKLGELNAGLLYNPKLRKPFMLKIFELVFL